MAKALNRKIQCTRCNYKWKVRGPLPKEVKFCPGCHSPYWNLPLGFLKRGRPLKQVPIKYTDYKEKFKFDLDFDSIKEYRIKSHLKQLHIGPVHNKEHMRIKAKINRGIKSPHNRYIKELDLKSIQLKSHLKLTPEDITSYGLKWELGFHIPARYFDIFDPVEKRLCYSLINIYKRSK